MPWNSSKVGLCAGLKSRRYWFDPSLFHKYSAVTQRLECSTVSRVVAGSNPVSTAISEKITVRLFTRFGSGRSQVRILLLRLICSILLIGLGYLTFYQVIRVRVPYGVQHGVFSLTGKIPHCD